MLCVVSRVFIARKHLFIIKLLCFTFIRELKFEYQYFLKRTTACLKGYSKFSKLTMNQVILNVLKN